MLFFEGQLSKKIALQVTTAFFWGCFTASNANAASLVDLINEVNLVHPQVLASRLASAAASADVETAKWQLFPTPSISVRSPLSDSDDQVQKKPVTVLALEQPIWTGGRLTGGLERAEASEDDAKASLDEVRQDVSLRVVQAYTEWYVARRKVRVVTESLSTHKDLLKQIDRRISEGLAAPSDRIQVLTRIEQVQADLEAYRGQAERGLASLQQLVGREVHERELTSDLAQPLQLSLQFELLQEQAFAISPQLKRAEASIKAAQAQIKLANAAYLPRISASLERQMSAQYEGQPDSANRVYLTAASDIGAGLSARTAKASAVARADAAVNQVDSVRLQLTTQLESDRLTLLSLDKRQLALSAAIDSADAVRESYARQYLQGRKTWLDVMNSEREVSQLQIQMVDVVGSQLIASWRLGILTRGVSGVAQQAVDRALQEPVSS